jgi:predicted Rossmann fold nucleotide-binding protein DprA/Smf involved in DNA uptake
MPYAYLALLHSLGLSQKKLRVIEPNKAHEYYISLNASVLSAAGYSLDSATRILERKQTCSPQSIQNTLQSHRVKIVHIQDDEYPVLLKTIPNAPTLLYVC